MRTSLVLLLLAGAVACSDGPPAVPIYDPVTRELVRIDYDYDANGTVDVRTFMRAGKPVRLEGDANGDGVTDRWEHYDRHGQLERVGASSRQDGTEDAWIYGDGEETRLELSTLRNGRIDRHEFYRGDLLVRAESDTDGDGVIDSWEHFEKGRLASLAVDEEKRGMPTRRLTYGSDGRVRIDVDPDGDGRFEAADQR